MSQYRSERKWNIVNFLNNFATNERSDRLRSWPKHLNLIAVLTNPAVDPIRSETAKRALIPLEADPGLQFYFISIFCAFTVKRFGCTDQLTRRLK
jgi:hypothetical protein